MPRRMINPEIWFNEKFANLSEPARLLFIGIFSNADDDGRFRASGKYLKGHIFPYDDKTLEQITEMRNECEAQSLIRVYRNKNGNEYLDLPGWSEHQIIRKDRYNPSKLPSHNGLDTQQVTKRQPDDNHPTTKQQPIGDESATTGCHSLSQSKSVKSSLVKSSLVKSSLVQNAFRDFIGNENDLTDFLTLKTEENISAGRARAEEESELTPELESSIRARWGIDILKQFWEQIVGKIPTRIFEGGLHALRDYPIGVVAKAFVKASKYKGGRHQSWKYIQAIIDEEMKKREPD